MGQMQDNTKLNIEKINNEARAWFVKIHHGGKACSPQKDFDEWLAVHQQHQKIEQTTRLINRMTRLLEVLPGGVIVVDGEGVVFCCMRGL